MPKSRNIGDWIAAQLEREAHRGEAISLEEWTEIRRTNDWEAIAEAWDRVQQAGGYDNLE